MRQVARAVFRFAAAMEPRDGDEGSLLDPRHLARAGLLSARFGAEIFDRIRRGPEATLAYAELDKKVRAFHLFETVVADLVPDATLDPKVAIASARERLGYEEAVWANEGIGYELTERCLRAGRPTRGLLTTTDALEPEGSFTVLHTGMGMALGEEALKTLASRPTRETLSDHIAACSEASRPGYAALAFEPLGLAVRLLKPELMRFVASTLADVGGPWSELFWHGVGRGVYFLPANLIPARSAPWRGLETCREDAADEKGRANASAGFAWAVTLVNLRQPAVVETFLGHHAEKTGVGPVISGVVSALSFWQRTTGGSRDLRRFVSHVAAVERRELWERAVRMPFEAACAGWNGAPSPERIAKLFRYC